MTLTHIEAVDGGEIIVVKVVEWIWMFGSTAVQRKEFNHTYWQSLSGKSVGMTEILV